MTAPARGTSVGFDDCPPTDIPPNPPNELQLQGTTGSKRRAQRFFHAVLVQFLADRKMTGQSMMSEGIEGFWLCFTEQELRDLLASAADTYSDVEYVPEPEDGDRKYRATEQGKKLRAPRSVSLTDPANVRLLVREAVKRWWIGVGGAAAFGVSAATLIAEAEPWVREVVVAVAVLAFLFLVLLFGYLGERDLKAAAQAWPRLAIYRPDFYPWVTHRWRQAFFPVAGWFFVALVAVALLLRRWEMIATLVAAALAVGVGVGMVVAFRQVQPLRKASAQEREWVEQCRAAKKR